jgi:hypothetical protein
VSEDLRGTIWRKPGERWSKRIEKAGPALVYWRWIGNPYDLLARRADRERFLAEHERQPEDVHTRSVQVGTRQR